MTLDVTVAKRFQDLVAPFEKLTQSGDASLSGEIRPDDIIEE